ncbi:MAG: RNA 2'-phosphotransferase [Sandaracinaceae bacterium]|nr:RNA 2'-phosphotransferase [Sandaracinaceae bacterium]
MTPDERIAVSKLMSWALRHAPREAGIALDASGWASVDAVLSALAARGLSVSAEELAEVVAHSDKQRFALSEDGARVRARQGHSVEVDLGLAPVEPPAELFHGTVERFLAAILREGLVKGERHHVHLSASRAIAEEVGRRRGRPVVLRVAAAAMARAGQPFYRTDNGVWLVEAVPPEHLEVLE